MTRPPHKRHRWRIASRCVPCRAPLLWACGYRTCDATRGMGQARHECQPDKLAAAQARAITIDLRREARRIFRGNIARIGAEGETSLW